MEGGLIQLAANVGLGVVMTVFMAVAGKKFLERLLSDQKEDRQALLKIATESVRANTQVAEVLRENIATNRELRVAIEDQTRVIEGLKARVGRA